MSNRRAFRLRSLLAVMVMALGALTTPAAHSDPTALLNPPEVRDVIISPDGGYLAMVRSDASKDTLVIIKRPEMAVSAGVASTPGERFTAVTWASTSQVLAETARDRGPVLKPAPTGRLISLKIDGSRSTLLKSGASGQQLPSVVVSILPDDPSHVLAAATNFCEPAVCTEAESRVRRLVKLNLDTGEETAIGGSPPVNGYYVSDPAGRVLMLAGYLENGRVAAYRWNNGIWESVIEFDPVEDLGTVPYAIDAAGRVLALANKRGTAALYEWDLASGETTEIFRDSVSDIDDQIFTWGHRELLAVRADPGFPTWHYLDESHAFTELHKALRAAFPDSDVGVTSMTRNTAEVIVRVHNDRNQGDFYLVNLQSRDSELLAQSRPEVPAESLADVEPLTLESRDGFELRGYLTLPAGSSGPHPMVVLIHDDPYTSRARWALNAEVQLLAARGYAALQINYRGSGGLGRYYTVAGAERDGRIVQRDIADAARWAIEQNITSEGQVCLLGRGYGGFAAVKGLIDNVGLFACAVGIDGFYDLTESVPVPESQILTPQRLLSVPTRLDMVDPNRSPSARIDRIGPPVLLLGENSQTISFRDALQAAGKTFAWQPAESVPAGYEFLLAFLDDHLKGVKPATKAATGGFGTSLDRAQREAFQKIVAKMRSEAKEMASRRVRSVSAIQREIRKIIDSHDRDVRALVDDEQWALYPDFKPGLAQRLESDLDVVRVR